MDFNNNNTYRDWPSYHQKPIVQEVNYSPLMVQSKEEVLVKEEWWPEATLAVVPSPIFLQRLVAAPVLCFSCFSATSLRECLGGLYIVVFRSS
jgi:hypothetical protein